MRIIANRSTTSSEAMRKLNSFQSTWRLGVTACAFLILMAVGACGTSAPPPNTQITEARSAVRTAEDVGARESAALEYRRAQQKLDEAQAAMARGRNDRARRLAEQAAVDAELAAIKARSVRTQATVSELQESIRLLRDEISRGEN